MSFLETWNTHLVLSVLEKRRDHCGLRVAHNLFAQIIKYDLERWQFSIFSNIYKKKHCIISHGLQWIEKQWYNEWITFFLKFYARRLFRITALNCIESGCSAAATLFIFKLAKMIEESALTNDSIIKMRIFVYDDRIYTKRWWW